MDRNFFWFFVFFLENLGKSYVGASYPAGGSVSRHPMENPRSASELVNWKGVLPSHELVNGE